MLSMAASPSQLPTPIMDRRAVRQSARDGGHHLIAPDQLAQVAAPHPRGARSPRQVAVVSSQQLREPAALPRLLRLLVCDPLAVRPIGGLDADERYTLHRVTQLSHVAGPAALGELLDDRLRWLARRLELLPERAREQRDVAFTFAQRWNRDLQHVESIIEISVSYTHLRAHETPEHLVC